MITYILIFYITWASQHTIVHPTQQFINIYLSQGLVIDYTNRVVFNFE